MWTTVLAVTGWLTVGVLYARYRRLTRIAVKAMAAVSEAEQIISSIYRVKLSCPACDWTDVVVRETRAEALVVGNERIFAHNLDVGHQLSGTPRTGFYRGEPIQ